MNLNYLYTSDAENYTSNMSTLIGVILSKLDKVGYISLNKSGESVYEFCKEHNIGAEKLFVIDMISSRFRKCKSNNLIEYLSVNDLEKQLLAVTKALKKNNCDAIIFDSLSALQVYYSEKEFIRFAHDLLIFTESQHIIANLIIQKKDVGKDWADSLIPLVDSVQDL